MMPAPVLIDSSVWINHINSGSEILGGLLKKKRVYLHPMVLGEIAMGSLRQRELILKELRQLPMVITASNAEVMAMVEWLELFSKGIGFVDAHLLASVRLTANATLLTNDNRLQVQAERLQLAFAT
jgi:predicted nucleic acid-binding protein